MTSFRIFKSGDDVTIGSVKLLLGRPLLCGMHGSSAYEQALVVVPTNQFSNYGSNNTTVLWFALGKARGVFTDFQNVELAENAAFFYK